MPLPPHIQRCEDYIKENDDLPDGAFFAKAEEEGLTIGAWAIYANYLEVSQLKKENEHAKT